MNLCIICTWENMHADSYQPCHVCRTLFYLCIYNLYTQHVHNSKAAILLLLSIKLRASCLRRISLFRI